MLSIPLAFIIGCILLFSIASALFRDIEPVDNADVYLSVDEIFIPKESENVYYGLVFDTKDQSATENEKVLKNLREAVKKPYYFCPKYSDGFSLTSELCPLNKINDIAKIAQTSALAKAKKGDILGAFSDALLPLQLGHLMQNSMSEPIDYLVALRIKNIGLETIQEISSKYTIPKSTAVRYANELSQFGNRTENLKQVFRVEYTMLYNSDQFNEKIPSNYYVQPNRYFKDLRDFQREKIDFVGASCIEMPTLADTFESSLKDEQSKFKKNTWLLIKQNALYEVQKAKMFRFPRGIYEKKCENDSLFSDTIDQLKMK